MWNLLETARDSTGRHLRLYQRGTAGYFYTIDIIKNGEVVDQVHIYDCYEVAMKNLKDLAS